MTRGSSRDYRFIGKKQVDRWWTKYSKWARFEAPTIIVEHGRFYLSGITSAGRRDRVGTPIRYVLAGDLRNADGCVNVNAIRVVINLLAKAADELQDKKNFAGLAESFDKIDNELIEKALADDDDASENVLSEIRKLLLALPDVTPLTQISQRRWCSGPTEGGLRELVVIAESVLKGDDPNGLAAYLNLADEKDVQSILGTYRFGGIVVKDGPRFPKALARPLISQAVGLSLILMLTVALAAWWLYLRSPPETISKPLNSAFAD
jgi:hypothetical protein